MSESPDKPKVLFLNDDEEMLILTEMLLDSSGFYPIVTSNESQALELLSDGAIDLFIQDLKRGPTAMGGWRLFEIINKSPAMRRIPSICMTGTILGASLVRRLAALGVNGYAALPIIARHFPDYMRAVIQCQAPRSAAELSATRQGREDWREEERRIREVLWKGQSAAIDRERLDVHKRTVRRSRIHYTYVTNHIRNHFSAACD